MGIDRSWPNLVNPTNFVSMAIYYNFFFVRLVVSSCSDLLHARLTGLSLLRGGLRLPNPNQSFSILRLSQDRMNLAVAFIYICKGDPFLGRQQGRIAGQPFINCTSSTLVRNIAFLFLLLLWLVGGDTNSLRAQRFLVLRTCT